MEQRLRYFPNHFWLLEADGKPVSYINGMVTNHETIQDSMFSDASLHREDGGWQAVFGLGTHPDCRKNGFGAVMMETLIQDAKKAGRKGCILTCKEKLISYYEQFGYENCGISASVHGGAVWYDMRLRFDIT